MFVDVIRIIIVIIGGIAFIQSLLASIYIPHEDKKTLRSTFIIAILFFIEICFLVVFIIYPDRVKQTIDVLILVLNALIGYFYLNNKWSSTSKK